jgi:hypothetical protein
MWKRLWQNTFDGDSPCATQQERLQWLFVSGTLCLMLATWRLWWPVTDFPQVPWFSWGCTIPIGIDKLLDCFLLAGLAMIFFAAPQSRSNQLGLLTFALSAIGLVLLNQQRAQPWMYQLILIAVVLAVAPPRLAFGLLRLLMVGIYFHSGLSKLDLSFCTGLGAAFWDAAGSLLLGGARPRPVGFNPWVLLFPLGEIVIAVALSVPATRRIAVWTACAMHLVLVALLSSWGLRHELGVLIWNVLFLFLNLVLFLPRAAIQAPTETTTEPPRSPGGIVASMLIAVAVLWPFLEPFGLCDVWPAWGLYAEHGEGLTFLITDSGAEKLPPFWREPTLWRFSSADPGSPADGRQRLLSPQLISLKVLRAPVYPSNRFLLGVILKVAAESGLGNDEISAEWGSRATRWSGTRTVRNLANLDEIQQAADQCWFNAQPRKTSK